MWDFYGAGQGTRGVCAAQENKTGLKIGSWNTPGNYCIPSRGLAI